MAEPVRPTNFQSRRRTGAQVGLRTLAALGGLAVVFAWSLVTFRPPARAPGTAAREPTNATTAFEPTDLPLGPIALVYVGSLALLALCCFVLIAAYPTSLPDVDRTLRIAPPGPRLQTDPRADLQRFRADEDKRLETYYWIDRQKGVVHIPIEQAMKNLAAPGVSGRDRGQP